MTSPILLPQALGRFAFDGVLAAARRDEVRDTVAPRVVNGFPEWVDDPDGRHPAGDAQTVAHDVVQDVFGTMPPATVHIEVADGDPVERLLAQGRGATLLVVGSRLRRGGIEPPDSVGLRVAALATCPLPVVH